MKYYKPKSKKIIYLNSEKNCSKTTTGTGGNAKNTMFEWNISDFQIDDLAEFKVWNFQYQGTIGTDIILFRITNLQIQTRDYFSSDGNYPIILCSNPGNTKPDDYDNNLNLILIPQIVNKISIIATDDLTDPSVGIKATAKFILVLAINEYQPEYEQITNTYGQAMNTNGIQASTQIHNL